MTNENPTRTALRERGITLQQVADSLGRNRATVHNAIHGISLSRRVLDKVDALIGWQPGTARENARTEREQRYKEAQQ